MVASVTALVAIPFIHGGEVSRLEKPFG